MLSSLAVLIAGIKLSRSAGFCGLAVARGAVADCADAADASLLLLLCRLQLLREEEELRVLLSAAGFKWQSHRTGEDVGLDGTLSRLISVLADA